jgi:hypothetical protein
MQGYSKGRLGPLMPVHYNGYVEASMEGCVKGCLGPLMLVHYMAM